MDIENLIEQLNRYFEGETLPRGTALDAATALSTLQAENSRLRADLEYEREHANAYHEECGQWEAENEKLKDQLYDGEGVNLVNYWMQQAKIEENGHRNCQAENEKLRAELKEAEMKIDSLLDEEEKVAFYPFGVEKED